MSADTHDLLQELIREMRGMREELRSIRADVAVLADEHRNSRQMQSPLMGRDLFREEAPAMAERR